MTDLEKILIGAVVGLSGALILAAIKWATGKAVKKIEDQPSVEAKLSLTTQDDILKRIGCPCMVVRIIGMSERASRISAVEASLVVDQTFVEAMESGFGMKMSHGISPNSPPPKFHVCLFRNGEASVEIKLERDDVVEFLLPVPFTPYEHFLRAPSQDVEIAMKLTNGERKILATGLEVQEMIRSLIHLQGNRLHGPHVTMQMGMTVSTKKIPAVAERVGTVNPNPINFPQPPEA